MLSSALAKELIKPSVTQPGCCSPLPKSEDTTHRSHRAAHKDVEVLVHLAARNKIIVIQRHFHRN